MKKAAVGDAFHSCSSGFAGETVNVKYDMSSTFEAFTKEKLLLFTAHLLSVSSMTMDYTWFFILSKMLTSNLRRGASISSFGRLVMLTENKGNVLLGVQENVTSKPWMLTASLERTRTPYWSCSSPSSISYSSARPNTAVNNIKKHALNTIHR